jgi:hypothetical protein
MSDTARPRVSVIIPTHNRSAMVRMMLDRLVRQTLPTDQFEVIVADDGSSDGVGGFNEEWPHKRDFETQWPRYLANFDLTMRNFPEPAVEIGNTVAHLGRYWEWRELWLELEAWTARAREVDVRDQLAEAARSFDGAGRMVVFGCGGELPSGSGFAAVLDFDRELLERAVAGAGDDVPDAHHLIGITALLPDRSADLVLITSRLSGLWPSWGDRILSEAHRIGADVALLDPTLTDPSEG